MKVRMGELREALEQHKHDGNLYVTAPELSRYLPYTPREIGHALSRLNQMGEVDEVSHGSNPKQYRVKIGPDVTFDTNREAARYYVELAREHASPTTDHFLELASERLHTGGNP